MNFVLIKNNILEIVTKFRQFILYAIIGVMSAGLDFAVFTVLINFSSINYLIANAISIHCGIINSFLFNRRFNFKVTDKPLKRFISFYVIGLIGLGISSILLWLLIDNFDNNIILSKLVVIFVITIVQFTLNKLITFNIKKDEE